MLIDDNTDDHDDSNVLLPLVLKDISVAYTDVPVIDEIDLEIRSGEIFGLMGLNGAGKTTMIKAILGLRQQRSGTISIYGQENISRQSKARLAYLPEKFEPPWFLTGMEFMKFSLSLYKRPFEREEIIEAAHKLALDTKALDRRMHTYSKGMRQKLGLMGTLLAGCSLFILDEPMSGLDPMARALVKRMIMDMRSLERTIFLSSHILADMDEICDRVAILHEGKIRYIGTPDELKRRTNKGYLEQAYLEFIEHAC
ncbi:MAG: ABC transporter ATP-binding protein [Alphaproteobacteria bacterium]|nr:ABC transporter ATP-binding protein [Alphaproteobacteria bacterium]